MEMTPLPSPLVRPFFLLLCLILPFSQAHGDGSFRPQAGQAYALNASIPMNAAASGGNTVVCLQANSAPSALALEGFFAAAFQSEYGDTERDTLIRWNIPMQIFVKGEPEPEDIQILKALLENLKSNVPGLPEMSWSSTETKANVVIAFVPFELMAGSLVTYADNNWGFMNCFSDGETIRYGMIAIASDVTWQKDRTHLIQEEFVNMLGLTKDLDFMPESIIYQPYTVTQTLADMDYEMLTLLYSPSIAHGMSREEAKAALDCAVSEH